LFIFKFSENGCPVFSTLSSDSDGIKANTYYQYLTNIGRQVITSAPYRYSTDSTLEWTCTQYDVLSRVTAVASFNGSVPTTLPSVGCDSIPNHTGMTTTTYDADDLGNAVTVTDPAGKARTQSSDVLGRLMRVIEDPNGSLNYTTTYGYDILGDLTQVNQGSQTRTFNYSSLGRLTFATNPESGNISYSYYDSGDLYQKTDARGVMATMTYDPLHRILTKSYSDSTPPVTYTYYLAGSSSSPNIGQLKLVSSRVPGQSSRPEFMDTHCLAAK
jgi:YD repeat-containing protein